LSSDCKINITERQEEKLKMPESKKAPCALCDTMSQFESHDNGKVRYYECPKCNQYAITDKAIRRLEKHPESKLALAQKVTAMPHDTKIIRIFINKVGIIDLEEVPLAKYS
jgi:hypothetical protein